MVVLLGPGEGRNLAALGARFSFKLLGDDSGGKLTLMEYTAPPRFPGAPVHSHPFEEAFYVLDGMLTVRAEDGDHPLTTGGFAHIPGGGVHSFWNPGDDPVTFLVIVSPAGIENLFERIVEVAGSKGGTLEPSDLSAINEELGITVLGPPPGLPGA